MNLPDQHLCPSLRGSLVYVLVICCALFLRVTQLQGWSTPSKGEPNTIQYQGPISDVQRNCTKDPYLTNDERPKHPELLWNGFFLCPYGPPRMRYRQMVSCRRIFLGETTRPTPTSTPLWQEKTLGP